MFVEALQELFDQQRARLSSALGPTQVLEAFEALIEESLDVKSIDEACCEELKQILLKTYEEPIASSNRLQKHGWSKAHIQDHMRRFLSDKIRRAGDIMRQFLKTDMASGLEGLDMD
jgi:hypothetical protein